MPRAARRRSNRSSWESRTELLERLVQSEGVGDCARSTVEWLARNASAAWAVCCVVDQVEHRVQPVASHNVSSRRLARFDVSLDDPTAPLVALMRAGVPSSLPASEVRGLGSTRPVLAWPLMGGFDPTRTSAPEPMGIVVCAIPAARRLRADWAAHQLERTLALLLRLSRLEAFEDRTRRERARLNIVLDAVPDAIILTDADGQLLVANAPADRLLGEDEGHSEGRRRAVTMNNMLFSAALSQRALAQGEPERRELLLVDPIDGSDLPFELLSAPAGDAREGTGIVSVLRNITDLRRAMEEIEANVRKLRSAEADTRAERDRLNLIISSVADPILVTDSAGNLVLMNPPAEVLFTAETGASEQRQRTVRANDATFSSFISGLFLLERDREVRGEFNLVHPNDGRTIPCEAVAGSISTKTGELTGIVTILHDRTEAIEKARLYEEVKEASLLLEQKVLDATTELARQNEILRRQHLELEQASALKSQFLANMSHEFRTPLNAILGYTSMALQGVSGELSPGVRRSLTRVDSNAQHLLRIINDILDISRIESGKMPIHLETFELNQLVAEMTSELEPLIGPDVQVTSRVAADAVRVRSDRQKLKQIVLNLLTNALKFTSSGTVSLVAETDGSLLHIRVKDTGIGISEEDQRKIFEDFRQADSSTTREYGGTGLGLSICRRLAGMLGGSISVHSLLGQGATFTLTVPRTARKR